MGFWDTAGRIGEGILTHGASEIPGFNNFIFGGDATKGIDTKPQNYDKVTSQLGQIAASAQGRAAPQAQAYQMGPAVQLAGGPQDQARQGQMGVANRLGAIASGQQAGAGELAVNRQVGQAAAQQVAAARMARGANAALAARGAARNMADIGLGGAGAAAQAQMQDQQNANAQLGSVYDSMRGQDIGFAGQNAQLGQQALLQQAAMGQQTALANLQAQLAQRGMNDQQQIAAMGQMLGWDQAKINAELAKAGIAATDKGILPGLLSAGGAIGAAAASDERLKTGVRDGSDAARKALAGMRAVTFDYRDPEKHGAGNQLGIIAQDLEKAGLGHAVIDTPEGKMVHGAKLATAIAAMLPGLDQRLSALEANGTPISPADAARKQLLARQAQEAALAREAAGPPLLSPAPTGRAAWYTAPDAWAGNADMGGQ